MKDEEAHEGVIYPPISRLPQLHSQFNSFHLMQLARVEALNLILHMYYALYLRRIRDITKEVAAAVVREAVKEDLAEGYRGMDPRELQRLDKVKGIFTVKSLFMFSPWASFKLLLVVAKIFCGENLVFYLPISDILTLDNT